MRRGGEIISREGIKLYEDAQDQVVLRSTEITNMKGQC